MLAAYLYLFLYTCFFPCNSVLKQTDSTHVFRNAVSDHLNVQPVLKAKNKAKTRNNKQVPRKVACTEPAFFSFVLFPDQSFKPLKHSTFKTDSLNNLLHWCCNKVNAPQRVFFLSPKTNNKSTHILTFQLAYHFLFLLQIVVYWHYILHSMAFPLTLRKYAN